MWKHEHEIITVACDDITRTIIAYTLMENVQQPIYILTGMSLPAYMMLKRQIKEALNKNQLNDFFDKQFFGRVSP